ncbi:hypothetical protein BDV98DRAFT_561760 [Pterulicium gracile]|uniref:Uncharacterized protein n=1 Tax=Pterulicium gracile TaxID=1884261 RepID=A0A5C3QXK5_9AGAR|nr:hypothetical protein BDV98DRAFT_561760 [Pterula gracilis]
MNRTTFPSDTLSLYLYGHCSLYLTVPHNKQSQFPPHRTFATTTATSQLERRGVVRGRITGPFTSTFSSPGYALPQCPPLLSPTCNTASYACFFRPPLHAQQRIPVYSSPPVPVYSSPPVPVCSSPPVPVYSSPPVPFLQPHQAAHPVVPEPGHRLRVTVEELQD